MTTLSRRNLLAGAAAVPFALGLTLPRLGHAQTAARPPISAWGKLPSIENVALSPDGKRVAMVMDNAGQRVVVDYELASGKAAAAALDGDKVRDVIWADNSHVLVVVSNTEHIAGQMGEQSYGLLFDIPGNKRRQLFSNMSNVVTSLVTGDFYRIRNGDGYRITASGYVLPEGINTAEGGARYTETMDRGLYAFTPDTAKGWKLDTDSRPIQDWVVKANGDVAARSEFDDDTKTWALRIKTGKGWKNVLEVKAPVDMPWMAGLGRDGESLVVRFDSGDDAGKYFEIAADGTRTLLPLEGDDNYPIFHPATYALAGFANSRSLETWTYYDPAMKRLPDLLGQALPDSFNRVLAFAENPKQVIVRSENAEDPGTYFFFDFTTGDFKEIGSSYPGITSEWVSPKSYITYTAADGLEIHAFLTLPPGSAGKNLPLVVLPHGGPEAMDDSGFDWLSQAIASRGYAVLQPNYRGSSGYGQAFTAKGYGEFGRKMQTDLSDGVAHLVRQGTVDAKRVAIAGGSYGGYAALAGVSLQSGIYNCAVSLAGLSNMKSFLNYRLERTGYDGDSYSMTYWRRFTGGDERLDEISPIVHAAAVTVPVLLIHGKDDVVVPFNQSQDMYDAMKKAGRPVELVVLSQEDHWLSRESTRIETLEATVGFLLKHNPV